MLKVMVEISASANVDLSNRAALDQHMRSMGVEPDTELDPVPMNEQGSGADRRPTSVIVNGWISDETKIEALERRPDVIKVWHDTQIAPFGN